MTTLPESNRVKRGVGRHISPTHVDDVASSECVHFVNADDLPEQRTSLGYIVLDVEEAEPTLDQAIEAMEEQGIVLAPPTERVYLLRLDSAVADADGQEWKYEVLVQGPALGVPEEAPEELQWHEPTKPVHIKRRPRYEVPSAGITHTPIAASR